MHTLEEIYSQEEFRAAEALFEHNSLVYEFNIAWQDIGYNRRRLYLDQVRVVLNSVNFRKLILEDEIKNKVQPKTET